MTQRERRDLTTTKILEAAAACLVECGYSGTTTVEVCRRAGVSRGALLHHFPTRDSLVAAAVEHLVHTRASEFRDALAGTPPESDLGTKVEFAIDSLWEIFRGPTVAAWIELMVAARTDPLLRKHLSLVERLLDREIEDAVARLFDPADRVGPDFTRVAPRYLIALLHGLALAQMADAERAHEVADDVLAATKQVARLVLESAGLVEDDASAPEERTEPKKRAVSTGGRLGTRNRSQKRRSS